MWALCSINFLAKFFPMGKTNALRGKITSFQQQYDESVPEESECWLLMQWRVHPRMSPSWNGELATDADVLS